VVDESAVLAALGYAPDSPVTWEPEGETPGSAVRLIVAGESPFEAIVRESSEPEAARNHAAVFEALVNAEYAYAPKLLGFAGEATIELAVPGITAMQLVPPAGAAEAAMLALAAWHNLPLREGLDWGRSPADLHPPAEVPLHRLGFSAAERDPALEPLLQAQDLLVESPFGFAHRNAIAANVFLAPGRAWLVDYGLAGFGPQYFDVAAFLLTSGIEAAGRRALAASYGRHRGIPAEQASADVDLFGLLWGIGWLLELPRRLITSLGDDPVTDSLKLAATRIDRGMRQPAGDSPIARAIRATLWPANG
jgi:hypothetical protein